VIDVTGYRDDRAHEQRVTAVGAFEIQATVDDKTVVLIDDVIFAVARFGQPWRLSSGSASPSGFSLPS